jgi:hypothetical protein
MQDRPMGEDLTSPIPQVDGAGSSISDPVKYTFGSDYHQEDICAKAKRECRLELYCGCQDHRWSGYFMARDERRPKNGV